MGIDPRGPRFSAAITAAVLAVVLVTGSVAAGGPGRGVRRRVGTRLAVLALRPAVPVADPAPAGLRDVPAHPADPATPPGTRIGRC